ncbi:hypothetical protein [Roseinatronobacter bogoriensis]|uniref:Uncharacterized protein n=1 Tax=Roseinatronobacter bogoriensis subsp. barguzinensis TaxID=441209 RepID=A0A2K8K571_9RHOB|nr:hypothetical protein [Rhodobaca]ATX64604.1 hypothetical protein BG454_01115 [Rhodobaca barguzinensis]MBB4209838.1 hypothetical protein [Rhodobaca bogoriensis DSM 18756]TDW33124.1 hypothetical protein LY39_03637 [Rhodobaca barguzinensis]TDY65954.1 hypothetical protein EV660_11517 [Rhodobaca bogoriensis DSM 18756]
MTQTLAKTWVWRSTEDSRAAGLVSVLAVAETLACVALYWVLFLWFGVTWHHWLILIATPLVLLRSERSIAKGVEWFNAYIDQSDEKKPSLIKTVMILGLATGMAGGVVWVLATNWVGDESNWAFFWKVMLIGWLSIMGGLAIAGALAGAVALVAAIVLAGMVAGPILVVGAATSAKAGAVLAAVLLAGVLTAISPSVIVGVWLRATATRFAATACYLWPGLRKLPTNWRFSMLVSDVWHPPELIPGDPRFTYGGLFSFSLSKVGLSQKYFGHLVINFIASLIFFLPAMLWRWAIKSTAWFYIPLLWVRRGWLSHEGEELRIWAESYSSKVINWLWLIFGGFSFAALAIGLFSFEKWLALKSTTAEAGAPMGVIGFLASLDWAELLTQPWLWAYIPSYALSVVIFFALDSIAAEIRAGATPESRAASIARWKWAANARAVLTNIGLLLALWYFLGAVDAGAQVQDFLARWS